MLNRTTCLIVGLAAVMGCSRQDAAPCMPEARYSTARSAPPVQIPDDLTPPNENDALRLPPEAVVSRPVVAGECLESPPPFFGDSARPVRSDAAAEEDDSSRRSRRQARREAQGEAQETETTAEPPPVEPPPPSSDERVIDN